MLRQDVNDERGRLHIVEDALLEADEAYADKDAECTMLRALLAQKEATSQRYVDTLEQIIDDWDYYTRAGLVGGILDIQAQAELLAADMRRSL